MQSCCYVEIQALAGNVWHMPLLICLALVGGLAPETQAQNTAPQAATAGRDSKTWYVQDPITGQIYRQQLIQRDETVTSWESVAKQRTVYVPQTTWQTTTVPMTQYVPQSQYELQPRQRGWWNPFRPVIYTWESKQVTRWVPQTTNVARTAPTTRFIATQQQVLEQRPTRRTIKRNQLVSTAVSQAPPNVRTGAFQQTAPKHSTANRVASTAWQPARPNLAAVSARTTLAPRTLPGSVPTTVPQMRPVQPSFSRVASTNLGLEGRNFQAPLRVAAPPASRTRDNLQAGLSATILR